MSELIWLTNIGDPKEPFQLFNADDPTGSQRRAWLNDKVIGRPKATDAYTVEQLEAMKMVGVYNRSGIQWTRV